MPGLKASIFSSSDAGIHHAAPIVLFVRSALAFDLLPSFDRHRGNSVPKVFLSVPKLFQ
jgi:hypothetical protein